MAIKPKYDIYTLDKEKKVFLIERTEKCKECGKDIILTLKIKLHSNEEEGGTITEYTPFDPESSIEHEKKCPRFGEEIPESTFTGVLSLKFFELEFPTANFEIIDRREIKKKKKDDKVPAMIKAL